MWVSLWESNENSTGIELPIPANSSDENRCTRTPSDDRPMRTPQKPNIFSGFWPVSDFFEEMNGARGRNRTTDTRIFNPLLYP